MQETEDDLIGDIYVEKSTSLLYEVKFFKGFVIVRPASPSFYLAIRKMSDAEFAHEFDEYYGDHEEVIDAIRGMQPEFIVEN